VSEKKGIHQEVLYRRDFGGCVFGHYLVGMANRDGSRSEVSELSRASTWRMVNYLKSSKAEYINMTTLTYPAEFPADGELVKSHLDKFLGRFMKMNESACWFLEFQKRGAPHFHILHTDNVPKGVVALDWAWANGEWWSIRTMTRVERLRKARGGVIAYAVKYAGKAAQKDVPEEYSNVGRFWGVRGNRSVWCASSRIKWDKGGEELEEAIYEVLHEGVSSGEIKMGAWTAGEGVFCQPVERLLPWWKTETQRRIELVLTKYALTEDSGIVTDGDIPPKSVVDRWSTYR